MCMMAASSNAHFSSKGTLKEPIMKKYRIVPKDAGKFWQLVQGMQLTPEEKELLQSCVIRHVEIAAENNLWEIALSTHTLIPANLLAAASEEIKAQCSLASVIFHQDVVNLEDNLEKIWPQVIEESSTR